MKTLRALALMAACIAAPTVHAGLLVVTHPNQLDFSGDFAYAVSFGTGSGATVGNANFTAMSATGAGAPAGVSISGFNIDTVWGGASNLGSTADANGLEAVMSSIMWSNGLNPGNINVNVNSGTQYRLQLLFSEGCCNTRHFDVNVESGLLTQEIVGSAIASGAPWISSSTQGYALTLDFTAADSLLNINLSRHTPGDTNYHISGFTLERLNAVPEPGSLALAGLALLGLGAARRRRAA